MKKRMITLLAIALIFGACLGWGKPASAAEGSFKDVPANHWAKKAIDYAVSKGYLKGEGNGNFRPNAAVTRAEFAAILDRVSTNEAKANMGSFSDLAGHWSEKEVNEAAAKGFLSVGDYSNGFKPGTALTRVEMAKWMASGLAAKDEDYKTALSDTKDTIVPVTEYYKGGLNKADYSYVSVVLGTGLMSGYPDDSFGAGKTTTRAEVAVILQRYEGTQEKAASSFRDLSELREVGLTGTNVKTVAPKLQVSEGGLNEIYNKDINMRDGVMVLNIHHYIFIPGSTMSNLGSVYGKMFVGEEFMINQKTYLVLVDETATPKVDNFTYQKFLGAIDSRLIAGFRVEGDVSKNFGYKTLPNDGSHFFDKGKSIRFWSATRVVKFLSDDEKRYEVSATAKDGTWIRIVNTEKNN
ncbi:S-layer homology domain-containing protein [Paenibacillus dokdonensis]|uniref:S-layer homology domain-containing protein n=1 Tax=Paenibacillus dokdonensis TaxID=2567944 RepID=A0ABU6GG47_9BACL|nr:S-layer homology domain-containing protein [Paenibacillus dokdonensis]MEC0238701.1 S-layer homology domain-containing protein [Paenibacillus dokdonensis]